MSLQIQTSLARQSSYTHMSVSFPNEVDDIARVVKLEIEFFSWWEENESRSRDSLEHLWNERKSASRSFGTGYLYPHMSWNVMCMDNWRSSFGKIRFVWSDSDQRFFISIIHLTTGLRNRFECYKRRSSRNGTRSTMSTRSTSSSSISVNDFVCITFWRSRSEWSREETWSTYYTNDTSYSDRIRYLQMITLILWDRIIQLHHSFTISRDADFEVKELFESCIVDEW